jgi:hypothetical protein
MAKPSFDAEMIGIPRWPSPRSKCTASLTWNLAQWRIVKHGPTDRHTSQKTVNGRNTIRDPPHPITPASFFQVNRRTFSYTQIGEPL